MLRHLSKGITVTPPTQLTSSRRVPSRSITHRGRDIARVDLPGGSGLGARSVIRHLGRLVRAMPDRIGTVEVSVAAVDDLTIDLLTGIAISRRLMGVGGRPMVLRVPGLPPTPGAAAFLGTMPFILTPDHAAAA
jgi:hypothetical protein